jgi:hypothetical protein
MNPKRKPGPLPILIGSLLACNVLLAGALVWAALRPAPVLIIPGVRTNQVLIPEEIPPAAARKFAYLYLSFFEDYTPDTVEERSTYLLRLLAPEVQEKVRRELLDRATYVIRTRESSHLLLPPFEDELSGKVERLPGGLLRLQVAAERRIYIASEEKGRSRVRYTLTLRPAFPSDQDAFGFVVAGQTLESESLGAAAQEPGRPRHD